MHTAVGTGAFLDSDAARPGPLDLPPRDSLDPSPSTDFACHHGPPRAGGSPPQTLEAPQLKTTTHEKHSGLT